jgi:ribosomal protein L35
MSAKTNKSVQKRVKSTKKGLIARVPGRNHFNAKESRSSILKKKGYNKLSLSPKDISRNLPHGA